jgi:hypothetical protein
MARGSYHRPRGPWLDDLLSLALAGAPDAAVARHLSCRHGPPRWTARQVRYWRHQLLAAERDPGVTPAEVRAWRRRQYQVRAGWGALLPHEDRAGPPHGPGWRDTNEARWVGGVELAPRDCDVLSLLRDRGPQTVADLAGALGLSPAGLAPRGRHRLPRLASLGLAVSLGFLARGPHARERVWGLGETARHAANACEARRLA